MELYKTCLFLNNQYNDFNIEFKVIYDCIVTFYAHFNLNYHTFILKQLIMQL